MVTHWVCNFAIGQLFLPATSKFGVSAVYLGFASVCMLAALFVQTAVLETKVALLRHTLNMSNVVQKSVVADCTVMRALQTLGCI